MKAILLIMALILVGCGSNESQNQTNGQTATPAQQIQEIDISDISGTWRGKWDNAGVLEIKLSPADSGNRKEFEGSMNNMGCLDLSDDDFGNLPEFFFSDGIITKNKIKFESFVGKQWVPPGANFVETIEGTVKIDGEFNDSIIKGTYTADFTSGSSCRDREGSFQVEVVSFGS